MLEVKQIESRADWVNGYFSQLEDQEEHFIRVESGTVLPGL